ncbi:MAG: DUF4249 domain-containing protein [Draconibacterium sp.]|nr:DUF4249 domain-containing protein [Draconibacterium sp.]
MKKSIIYFFLLVLAFSSCEDVYTPDIEKRESVIVVDARIVAGNENNSIRLSKSVGFNDTDSNYPVVSNATVTIIDSNGDEFPIAEESSGNYPVLFPLNLELEYKLEIAYEGNTYESTFEPVPKVPDIDTLYGVPGTKVVQEGGENDVNNFREKVGLQLYVDIKNDKKLIYYRFNARKILQNTYPVEVMMMGEVMIETMFAWNTFLPQESFNLASPPDYSSSTDIIKHPLYFMEQKAVLNGGNSFAGWILVLYQYGLSKSAHSYYNDLNNQLNSDGRLFDPLYVQARSNIKCTNNPEQLILGNFEISSVKEHRYFVRFVSGEKGYLVRRIPYFYEISHNGEQLLEPPAFWEYDTKNYPNEQ